MLKKLSTLIAFQSVFIMQLSAYDATVPMTGYSVCTPDLCTFNGGSTGCSSEFSSSITCNDFDGCYTGSPLGNTCATS